MADTKDSISSIILLVVGVGVAILILIFVGSLGGRTFGLIEDDIAEIGNHPITGESFTPLNGTYIDLEHSFIQEGTMALYNASSYAIGLGNYTIYYDAGKLVLLTNMSNGTTMYANYTWGAADVRISVQNSIVSGFSAVEETGSYLPIIVLAVVIALVLVIILPFGMMNKGNQGGAL